MSDPNRVPVTNEIKLYLHCLQCLKEKPPNVSPSEWSRTQTGFTKHGLQIWCNRHNKNVMHVDFEGVKHPAQMHSVEPTECPTTP